MEMRTFICKIVLYSKIVQIYMFMYYISAKKP